MSCLPHLPTPAIAVPDKEKVANRKRGVEDLGSCAHLLSRSHHISSCLVAVQHVLHLLRILTYVASVLVLPPDFYIGDECNKPSAPGEQKIPRPGYAVKYPLRHGIVEDWDLMVRCSASLAHVFLFFFFSDAVSGRCARSRHFFYSHHFPDDTTRPRGSCIPSDTHVTTPMWFVNSHTHRCDIPLGMAVLSPHRELASFELHRKSLWST